MRFHVADLYSEQAVIELCTWLEDENLAIDFLINNAGLGDMGLFATADVLRVEQMLAVNVTALTLLTRLLLPEMIRKKNGAVLNVSSSAGFLPIPEFAVYAATKAFVTSFSEAIRTELRGTGVTVSCLCPGPVPTEFIEVARRSFQGKARSSPSFVQVSVEETVRVALRGVVTKKPVVIPGLLMKVGMLLTRLTPMPLLRLVARFSTSSS